MVGFWFYYNDIHYFYFWSVSIEGNYRLNSFMHVGSHCLMNNNTYFLETHNWIRKGIAYFNGELFWFG